MVTFQDCNLYSYLKELEALPSWRADCWILKTFYFLENRTGTDNRQCRYILGWFSYVYVTLSKAKKHVPYGELIRTTDCVTLYPRCRTKEIVITELDCILILSMSTLYNPDAKTQNTHHKYVRRFQATLARYTSVHIVQLSASHSREQWIESV
jgi:hypothetical protein